MVGGDGSQEAGLRKLECSPASGLSGLLPNLPSCVQAAAAVDGDALPPHCDRRIPSTTVSQNQSSFSSGASVRHLSQWQEKEYKSLWNNSIMSHLKMLLIFWMGVLSACMSCYHMHAWRSPRPQEGIRSLETGVTVLSCQVGLQPGSSGRTGRLLTLEPSL